MKLRLFWEDRHQLESVRKHPNHPEWEASSQEEQRPAYDETHTVQHCLRREIVNHLARVSHPQVREVRDSNQEDFMTHVLLAPVISLILWVSLRAIVLIAASPATSNFSQQTKGGLGWIVWINHTTLLSIDVVDWFVVVAGVPVIVSGAKWARKRRRVVA